LAGDAARPGSKNWHLRFDPVDEGAVGTGQRNPAAQGQRSGYTGGGMVPMSNRDAELQRGGGRALTE